MLILIHTHIASSARASDMEAELARLNIVRKENEEQLRQYENKVDARKHLNIDVQARHEIEMERMKKKNDESIQEIIKLKEQLNNSNKLVQELQIKYDNSADEFKGLFAPYIQKYIIYIDLF